MSARRKSPSICNLQVNVGTAGTLSCVLQRSSRRRTLELSVPATDTLRLLAPNFVEEGVIRQFILSKEQWILRRLRELARRQGRQPQRRYADGHTFLFLGREYPLRVGQQDAKQPRLRFDGRQWNIDLPVPPDDARGGAMIKNKLVRWYREQAREILGSRLFQYGRRMDLEPQRITVRTQKRMWGCCHCHSRAIFLNWHLVMAPMDVIDYVIVHELAHLDHPNHSRAFWRRVAEVLPDYRYRQMWLRDRTPDTLLPDQ